MNVTHRRPLVPLVLALLALAMAGCASPPWLGMAESEIAAWKQMDVGADLAQEWRRAGFGPAEAAPWIEEGIDARTAKRWDRELFSADQAASWRGADFSLDEAIENRARGLAPIGGADEETAPRHSNGKEAEPVDAL